MTAPRCASVVLVPGLALLAAAVPAFAASCESLASLSTAQMVISSARIVPAGGATRAALPPYCQVAATLKPSSDSDIKIEIWLPAADWNGKYQAVGNGGWAGSISYDAMAQALAHGYATSSTDTGHSGGGASFALGHPEKVIDYAYRSEHEMVGSAKAIITAFYGRGPRLSYWNSCSSGGKQGLKEAQRYPDDFDGIIAGSPANNWTGRAAYGVWVAQAVHKDEASYIPPAKYQLIHNAVLQMCDALDGARDGLIEDPTRCKFDPQVLECKGSDASACLTQPQVEAARKIYAGVVNQRTKREIFPGLQPGSELAWNVMAGPQPFGIANEYFKYVIFKNPAWDYRTFDFAEDMDATEKADNGTINATDPNLSPFFRHGGKLVQYHGWNDWQISPLNSIHYYQSVQKAVGVADADKSYRLFMAPGMGHCGGGEGPNRFDMLTALEQWVEHGQAPKQVIASQGDRSRPLCPYPQVAKYRGSGSIDDAANFACVVPSL